MEIKLWHGACMLTLRPFSAFMSGLGSYRCQIGYRRRRGMVHDEPAGRQVNVFVVLSLGGGFRFLISGRGSRALGFGVSGLGCLLSHLSALGVYVQESKVV